MRDGGGSVGTNKGRIYIGRSEPKKPEDDEEGQPYPEGVGGSRSVYRDRCAKGRATLEQAASWQKEAVVLGTFTG
jgi:hypothetical protein